MKVVFATMAGDALALAENSGTVHAVVGCLLLGSGIIAIATRKGSTQHRFSGKISVLMSLFLMPTALILLTLTDIHPRPSTVSNREELVDFLAIILLTAIYSNLQGYRWAVNHKPKINADALMMGMTLFISVFCLALTPFDVFIAPFKSSVGTFPLQPISAGLILIGISLLHGFFFVDDLKSYLKGQVSPQERITKHMHRSMAAVGGAFTAFAINNLGPIFVNNNWTVWPVWIVPPTIFL
jgi:hypothetical protein